MADQVTVACKCGQPFYDGAPGGIEVQAIVAAVVAHRSTCERAAIEADSECCSEALPGRPCDCPNCVTHGDGRHPTEADSGRRPS